MPTSVVPSLAGKVLGSTAKESDLQLIQFWVSQREGEYGPGCEMSQWSRFSFLLNLMNQPLLFLLSSLFPPLSLVRVYPVEPLNKGHLETSNVSFIEVSLEVL